MSGVDRVGAVCVLFTGLSAGSLVAQSPAESSLAADVSPQTESAASSAGDVMAKADSDRQRQYATSLDGKGFLALDGSVRRHLLVGGSVGSGWDSNPRNDSKGGGAAYYILSPYIGFVAATPRSRYLMQYHATNTGYGSGYGRQTLHEGSAAMLGDVNDRWSWDFRTTGRFGSDSSRLLGPQQTVSVGTVLATDPNSAAYYPNAGTVGHVDGDIGVTFRRSERDSVGLRVADQYSHLSGLSVTNNITSVDLTYNRDLSTTLSVLAYGRNSIYQGRLHCDSVGGGVGVRWRARQETTLILSGGPQLDASKCGTQQGFSYNLSFATSLSGKSELYVTSSRDTTTSYVGLGVWQDSVSGGYRRRVSRLGTASANAGYVASHQAATVAAYSGTYFDCGYEYELGHGLRTSASYRAYFTGSDATGANRSVTAFALTWTPSVGHLLQ